MSPTEERFIRWFVGLSLLLGGLVLLAEAVAFGTLQAAPLWAVFLAGIVTVILAVWPIFVPGTKITNPSILAIPSPRLLVSEIVTLYSLPTSTGFLKEPKPPPELLPNPLPRFPKLK